MGWRPSEMSLAHIINWEVGTPSAFDRPRTPEEVMAKLEERVGLEGRRLPSSS
jgi:hypothetical protein